MNPRKNPYVGPIPFGREHTLPARDQAVWELRMRLRAERLVLLHSPSGAGKTSLIEAANGLRTALKKDSFRVLPSIRINGQPDPERPNENRYEQSVMQYLSQDIEAIPQNLKAFLDDQTVFLNADGQPLAPSAGPRPALYGRGPLGEVVPQREVLIFDQFEELLTSDVTDDDGRTTFLSTLSGVLEARHRYALFVIREDYLGALEPWFKLLPTHLAARYRLELLNEAGAKAAVQEPAGTKDTKEGSTFDDDAVKLNEAGAQAAVQEPAGTKETKEGITFDDDAVKLIVDELRVIKADGSAAGATKLGLTVEPVLLQVVCRQLWEELTRQGALDDGRVTVEEIQANISIDTAITQFYAGQVEAIARAQNLPEARLRRWIGRQLVSPEGIRLQVREGGKECLELGKDVLASLVNAHLVRAEGMGERRWYELSHDRLVEPIRTDNAAWEEKHLPLYERQAQLWADAHQDSSFLLLGDALVMAEQALLLRLEKGEPPEPQVTRFLLACRTKEKAQQDARQRNFRIRAGLTLGLILALVLSVWAFSEQQKAEDAAVKAEVAAKKAEDAKLEADEEREKAKVEAVKARLSRMTAEINEIKAVVAKAESVEAQWEAVEAQFEAVARKRDAIRQKEAADRAKEDAQAAAQKARISLSFAAFERIKDQSPNDAAMALLIAATAPAQYLTGGDMPNDMTKLQIALAELETRPLLIGQSARPGDKCPAGSSPCFQALSGLALSCEQLIEPWSRFVADPRNAHRQKTHPLLPTLNRSGCNDSAGTAAWIPRLETQAERIPALKLWTPLGEGSDGPGLWVDAEGKVGRTASSGKDFKGSTPETILTTEPVVAAAYSIGPKAVKGEAPSAGKLLLLHRNGLVRLITLKQEGSTLQKLNEQRLTIPRYNTETPEVSTETRPQTQQLVLLPGGDYALTLDRAGIVRVWDLTQTEQFQQSPPSGTKNAEKPLQNLKETLRCIQPYRPSDVTLEKIFQFTLKDSAGKFTQDTELATELRKACSK